MKEYYLYRHIRPDKNEVFYIGIGGTNTRRAWETRYRNSLWNNVVNKNKGNYIVEILFTNLTKEEACLKEIEFIALYKRRQDGGTLTNFQLGGDLKSGYIMSNEQKLVISKFHKGNTYALGFKWSQEDKEKMSLQRRGRVGPNRGKSFSEETKRNMSLGHMGNKSHLGKIAINNGIRGTFIYKEDPIPEGWTKGRLITPSLGRNKKLLNNL